ncbi:hypothetical protein JCM10213_006191 [Rhodosporidiobolus nylandii]
MPAYKQIAKHQARRAKRTAAEALSDEDSATDSDASQLDNTDDSDADDSASDTDSDEEDDGLGGAGNDEPLDENTPRPPPAGFPTAQEALENPVASTASLMAAMKDDDDEEEDDEDEEEAPLVCVFCPNKVLKKGKMTEVHLASKDHKRRLARFKAHLEAPTFPEEHLTADARWVSSQLDKAVLERLSLQTQVGGKKAGTVKPAADAAASPDKSTPAASSSSATPAKTPSYNAKSTSDDLFFSQPAASTSASTSDSPAKRSHKETKAALVAAAEAAGTSVREQARQLRKEQRDKVNEKKRARKERKTEKNERIKKRKVENGEAVTPHIPSKPKFVEKIRPTDEEIAKRQAWKKARDEAKAAGKPIPPRPVLAYEHGGKVPEKKGKGKGAKDGKQPAAGEKKERVVNEARLAKRKEKKERRKSEKAQKAAAAAPAVLEEV